MPETFGAVDSESIFDFDQYSMATPASGLTFSDEFDDSSLDAAWTIFGEPFSTSETTFPGFLYIRQNEAAYEGIRRDWAPGTSQDFGVAICIGGALLTDGSFIVMRVEDSSNVDVALIGLQNVSGSLSTRHEVGGGTPSNTALGESVLFDKWYLFLRHVQSTNSYLLGVSKNGHSVFRVENSVDSTTIAKFSIGIHSASGTNEVSIDWCRAKLDTSADYGAVP